MKTTHNEIEIEYQEGDNRWYFELRGRQRSAESLAKAKEYIDKPVNTKEEKPFERIQVYVNERYGRDGYKLAEVTSVAEKSGWTNRKEVWVMFSKNGKFDKKKREKRYADECFPVTENNTELVNQVLAVATEIDELQEKELNLKKKLTPIDV